MTTTRLHPKAGTALLAALTAAALTGGAVTATQAFAEPEAPAPAGGQSPGTVYANRALPAESLPRGARNGNVYMYWSEGADGRTHLSGASVFEPLGTAPAGGWPSVAVVRANGIAAQCSSADGLTPADSAAASTLLNEGYAVIVPDLAAIGTDWIPLYVDSAAVARTVMDGVRASVDIDEDLSPRWAVVGETHGATAALTLARKATAWQGRDLDFRGAAAQSIPAGFADLITGLGPSSPPVPAAVVADVVFALASLDALDDPAVTALADHLSPLGKTLVDKARSTCTPDFAEAVRNVSLAQLVSTPIANSPQLAALIRRTISLPEIGFTRPVLLSQPLVDDSVNVPDSLRFATQAQLGSNKVTVRTYLTGDERDIAAQEKDATLGFLRGVF